MEAILTHMKCLRDAIESWVDGDTMLQLEPIIMDTQVKIFTAFKSIYESDLQELAISMSQPQDLHRI